LKTALVVHPWFPIFGGGEYLCLCVCQTLQQEGYKVKILTDTYRPDVAEQVYSMGKVLADCEHIPIQGFHAKNLLPKLTLIGVQRIIWARKLLKEVNGIAADVIFVTQPSWFQFRQSKRYDFMYNFRDLFTYPVLPGRSNRKHIVHRLYLTMLKQLRNLLIGRPVVKRFLALSNMIYRDLLKSGIVNAEMIFPPARLDVFYPKQKKRQIVISCRIDPAKNLEGYFTIAKELPKEKFLLVTRDNETTRLAHPGYAEKLLAKKPANVELVNSVTKNVPETIEESLVYLYTGIEPGIGIAIMEACGAGCIPMAPHIGGGGEIVRALGAGQVFDSYPDAVRRLKLILEQPEPSPDEIRQMALKRFGMERFQTRIRELL
jgi:glycosyltransferase involved in cell wall biosynthesis